MHIFFSRQLNYICEHTFCSWGKLEAVLLLVVFNYQTKLLLLLLHTWSIFNSAHTLCWFFNARLTHCPGDQYFIYLYANFEEKNAEFFIANK